MNNLVNAVAGAPKTPAFDVTLNDINQLLGDCEAEFGRIDCALSRMVNPRPQGVASPGTQAAPAPATDTFESRMHGLQSRLQMFLANLQSARERIEHVV